MALYIAVCDDNAADRKQIERLLDRGNKDSLMKTPNRYNLFLITATADSELNGITIANEIKQAGIDALIGYPGSVFNVVGVVRRNSKMWQ